MKRSLGSALCLVVFLVWFLLASFLPDTITPKPVVFGIPTRGADLIILFSAIPAFALWLCTSAVSAGRTIWHMRVPLWFSLILGYATVSVVWAGMDTYNTRAMLFSLAFSAAGFILPFSVIASLTRRQLQFLGRMMSLALAFTASVYSLESFVGLGLRSELGHFYTYGFGIERVKGPLFEASTGYMILLPAAAFLLQDWFDNPKHALANAIGILALSITLIGIGSRFALLVVALFLILIVITGRNRRTLGFSVLALGAIAFSAVVVFQYATSERLQSFEDPQRSDTYAASLRIVESRALATNLSGSGYGSVWPWYMRDWEMGDRIARGHMMVSTDYGAMLFQPHSVFLLLGVELGAAGLLFFVALWRVLCRLVFRAVASQENAFAVIGVACAALGMFSDLILFKGPKVSAFWWFFLLAALALRGPESAPESST
jgi:hypothetical protein